MLKYHLIWIPRRQRKVLVEAVKDRLEELLREKAEELRLAIVCAPQAQGARVRQQVPAVHPVAIEDGAAGTAACLNNRPALRDCENHLSAGGLNAALLGLSSGEEPAHQHSEHGHERQFIHKGLYGQLIIK